MCGVGCRVVGLLNGGGVLVLWCDQHHKAIGGCWGVVLCIRGGELVECVLVLRAMSLVTRLGVRVHNHHNHLLTHSLPNQPSNPPDAKLTPENMKGPLRDVRRALLEADVSLPVVRRFIKKVEERAQGLEVRLL